MSDNMFNRFLYSYAPIMGGIALILIVAIILFFMFFDKFF